MVIQSRVLTCRHCGVALWRRFDRGGWRDYDRAGGPHVCAALVPLPLDQHACPTCGRPVWDGAGEKYEDVRLRLPHRCHATPRRRSTIASSPVSAAPQPPHLAGTIVV